MAKNKNNNNQSSYKVKAQKKKKNSATRPAITDDKTWLFFNHHANWEFRQKATSNIKYMFEEHSEWEVGKNRKK